MRAKTSRADGQLNFAAAAFHALEGLRQVGQANFFGDKIVSHDVAAANGFERFANETRRVMKRRDQLDLGIVNGGGVNRDARARREAAEEVDYAAAANHCKSLLP